MRRFGNETVERSVKRPASMEGRVDQTSIAGLVVRLSRLILSLAVARAIVMDGTQSRRGMRKRGTALVGARQRNEDQNWPKTNGITDHTPVAIFL